MNILFYSKFIFNKSKPAAKPSQAPSQTVGGRMATQSQKSKQHVEAKKKAAESLKKKKEGLLGYWQNNNPKGKIEAVEDDPKAVVFNEIRDPLRAKEAYMLMSLIEKFWEDQGGLDLALRLYEKAKAGRKKAYDIDFKPFENFFRKGDHAGSSSDRLGFYYWASKNEWYTYDDTSSKDPDESGGSSYLVQCTGHIKKEFGDTKNKDSGLSVDQEKDIGDSINAILKESKGYYNERYRTKGKDLVKWFRSKVEGKWGPIDSKTAKTMNVVFGAGVGKYLYRYNKEQNRIYFIKLQGADLKSGEGESGYIDIKDNKLGKWKWHTDMNELKTGLLDKMKPETVSQELLREKTKAGEEVKEDQAVDATKKTIIKIHKIRTVKYSKLSSEYGQKLKEELKKELVSKQGYDEAKAESVAQASVDNLKRKIEKKINDDAELKKAKEKDPTIKITLDTNGEPKVDFRETGAREKVKKALEKAKKAASGVNLDALIKQKTEGLTKKLGPLGMFLKFFGVDLNKDMTEYYKTGKKSLALSLVLGITSFEIGRRVLRGKGVDKPKDLEVLVKKNGGVIEKDQPFNKEFKPKGYKITIPKGKGIKPGETFTANGKIVSPAKKEKKKKSKFSFFGFLGGGSKSSNKFVMDDQEIIITQNDKVPKGTIIPKGAKIEKV